MKRSMSLLPLLLAGAGCTAATEPSSRATQAPSGGTSGGTATSMTAGSAGIVNSAGAAGSGGITTTVAGAGGTPGSGGSSGSGGTSADPGGPAPPATWVNATGNLAGMASDCISVGRVGAQPGSKRVIVGVAQQSLFASDDSGQTWQALGTGGGSAPITNRASSITFDPEHPEVFWETGTHNGGGMYRTADGGQTFVQLGSMTMSQDAAVDFGDPERKTLLTGTHGKGVFRSTDGGVSFASVGDDLPGNTLWPLLIDSQTHLMGTYEQDPTNPSNGIYRTTDGGANWTRVSSLAPSHDGSLVRTSDDSIYLALSGNSGIAKSTDLGQSWAEVTGPTAAFATPSFSINPVELPGGKLVTIGTDHLVISSDGGASWQPIGEPLPFKLSNGEFGGVTYSVESKTFFLWRSSCGANVVLDDAIMSAGFDYALQ